MLLLYNYMKSYHFISFHIIPYRIIYRIIWYQIKYSMLIETVYQIVLYGIVLFFLLCYDMLCYSMNTWINKCIYIYMCITIIKTMPCIYVYIAWARAHHRVFSALFINMMSASMKMNMCNRWRASTKHTKTNTEDVTNNNIHESISQVSVA